MTHEQIKRALVEIRQLAEDEDHEGAHCAELALHSAFLDHVAGLHCASMPSMSIMLLQIRALARLVRSSREIVFRRGA